MGGYRDMEDIVQNMVDAGCSEEIIKEFLACLYQGEIKQGLSLLLKQRENLLGKIHQGISCVAFLDEQLGMIRKESAR